MKIRFILVILALLVVGATSAVALPPCGPVTVTSQFQQKGSGSGTDDGPLMFLTFHGDRDFITPVEEPLTEGNIHTVSQRLTFVSYRLDGYINVYGGFGSGCQQVQSPWQWEATAWAKMVDLNTGATILQSAADTGDAITCTGVISCPFNLTFTNTGGSALIPSLLHQYAYYVYMYGTVISPGGSVSHTYNQYVIFIKSH